MRTRETLPSIIEIAGKKWKNKKMKNKNKKEIEIEIVNSDDDEGYFASWLMYGLSVDEYEYN